MQVTDWIASLLENFQESLQLWKLIEKLSTVVEAFESIRGDIKLLTRAFKVYYIIGALQICKIYEF